MDDYYLLIIDTQAYAGSMMRELMAYCTGLEDAHGFAGEEADAMRHRYPAMAAALETLVTWSPDDDGCLRPCRLVATPGYWNDGFGNIWPETTPVSDETVRRVYRESCERHDMHKDAKDAIERFPAYQSVGMAFTEHPAPEVVAFVCARAREYAERYDVVLTGFRLVRRVTEESLISWYPPEWAPGAEESSA